MKSKVVVLSEIGEFKNGLNFNQNDYGIGYPIINVKQLYQSRFATIENLLGIKSDFAKKIDGYFVEKGDLLFVRGSMVPEGAGKLVMVNKFTHKTVFSGFIIRFRITNKKIANPLFLTYLLRSTKYREMFVRIASGSVHSNMNQEILGKIQVELPEISTQIQITKILDDIDTKIELLQNQNKILEQIIQSIFKSWFIDFDGVTEFEDSELGKIPKDWEVKILENIKDSRKNSIATGPFGSNLKTSEYVSDGIPVIRGKDVELGLIKQDDFVFVTEEKANSLPASNVFSEDIIVISQGNIGTIGIVPKISKYSKYLISSNLMKISVNLKIISPYYVYYYLKSQNGQQELLGNTSTTGVPHIAQPSQTLKNSRIIIPDYYLLQKFNTIASSITLMISLNRNEIMILQKNRDSLLPKLMSGEIRV